MENKIKQAIIGLSSQLDAIREMEKELSDKRDELAYLLRSIRDTKRNMETSNKDVYRKHLESLNLKANNIL